MSTLVRPKNEHDTCWLTPRSSTGKPEVVLAWATSLFVRRNQYNATYQDIFTVDVTVVKAAIRFPVCPDQFRGHLDAIVSTHTAPADETELALRLSPLSSSMLSVIDGSQFAYNEHARRFDLTQSDPHPLLAEFLAYSMRDAVRASHRQPMNGPPLLSAPVREEQCRGNLMDAMARYYHRFLEWNASALNSASSPESGFFAISPSLVATALTALKMADGNSVFGRDLAKNEYVPIMSVAAQEADRKRVTESIERSSPTSRNRPPLVELD